MRFLKEKIKNMELQEKKHDKIIAKLEQDHKILLYVSTDVTRELQFINRE